MSARKSSLQRNAVTRNKPSRFSKKQKAISTAMAAGLFVSVALAPGLSMANGWVDDWITMKNVSGPSAYEGAKRNYYSAGSFSMRYPVSNDNLMTITMPHLKSGCGGIDGFLGGMSFMNVDYLVQKLQRILAAAPAAAFDIALKTLAPQVAETIKTLESIVDKLNNIQLDDCKAAKALVATTTGPFAMNEAFKAETKSATADFLQSSGTNDLWHGISTDMSSLQKTWSGNPQAGSSNTISNAAKGATAGCEATIQTIFGDGSMLDNLAATKGINSDYIPILRGFVGDVLIQSPTVTGSTYQAIYINPCDENKGLMPFLDGNVKQRKITAGAAGACTDVTDTNKNLNIWAANQMGAVVTAMKSKTGLSPDEKSFLQSIPLPVSAVLKSAIATKTENQVIASLSSVTAKAFAYYMLNDLLGKAVDMHAQAKHVMDAQKNAKAGSDPSTCNTTLLAPAMAKIEQLEIQTDKLIGEARETYATAMSESVALETYVHNMKLFQESITAEVAQQFGAPVARRATGG